MIPVCTNLNNVGKTFPKTFYRFHKLYVFHLVFVLPAAEWANLISFNGVAITG